MIYGRPFHNLAIFSVNIKALCYITAHILPGLHGILSAPTTSSTSTSVPNSIIVLTVSIISSHLLVAVQKTVSNLSVSITKEYCDLIDACYTLALNNSQIISWKLSFMEAMLLVTTVASVPPDRKDFSLQTLGTKELVLKHKAHIQSALLACMLVSKHAMRDEAPVRKLQQWGLA
jgi:hypothetical protein